MLLLSSGSIYAIALYIEQLYTCSLLQAAATTGGIQDRAKVTVLHMTTAVYKVNYKT